MILGLQVRKLENKAKTRLRRPAKRKELGKFRKATKWRMICEKNQRPKNIHKIVNVGPDQGRRKT